MGEVSRIASRAQGPAPSGQRADWKRERVNGIGGALSFDRRGRLA